MMQYQKKAIPMLAGKGNSVFLTPPQGQALRVLGKISTLKGSIFPKNSITKLLQQMNPIASALITSLYITDFTVHDTKFIRQTKAKTPFIWLVFESGTHLYTTDEVEQLRNFLQILDYYEKYSINN